ncbi:M28 family peptidase [bacterium]|nr:M28 family peptidase [bacterium]
MKKSLVVLFVLLCFSFANAQMGFDAKNALNYIKIQCDFGARVPNTEAHEKCKNFLVSELKKFTPKVKEQKFTYNDLERKQVLNLTNIVASFGEQKTRIMLCAHWDSRPFADKENPPSQKPVTGANDGASGVAALLEIANYISKHPLKNYGIDIIFFDGEDWGEEGRADKYCLGSEYFSKNMLIESPAYGILLDLIADKNPEYKIEGHSSYFAADIVYKVWQKAKKLGYTEFSDERIGMLIDDHLPFLKKGIPVIDIIDLDYPHWHTLKDTPENCSAQGLFAVGETLLALIYE